MKITIEQSDIYEEIEINIKCKNIDEKLEKLTSSIRLYNSTISGKKDGKIYFLKPEDVLFFDTVDEKCFIYTIDSVYETSLKLYEIVERFSDSNIIRINKSTALNLMKVEYVSPLFNGRIEAVLQTGEKLIISRQYAPIFKSKLSY